MRIKCGCCTKLATKFYARPLGLQAYCDDHEDATYEGMITREEFINIMNNNFKHAIQNTMNSYNYLSNIQKFELINELMVEKTLGE